MDNDCMDNSCIWIMTVWIMVVWFIMKKHCGGIEDGYQKDGRLNVI